jgi:hypothetical protein
MNNLQKLYASLQENRKINEKNDFQDWLNSYYDENITVYEKCNEICKSLILICKKNGYEINNEKQFKNEIASYLYYNNAMC